MEVDTKPTEDYSDIGGLDKQIEELVEAVVLPMTHKEKFQNLGIKPPKGVLLYGPPGTGKTLMARACAAQTNSCFLKLAGPQLVQVFLLLALILKQLSLIPSFLKANMQYKKQIIIDSRCSLVMVPNLLGMPLLWPRRKHRLLFLLTN